MSTAARSGRRIYVAGATGVIGTRLVPLLVGAGYTVGAMTRSADKAGRLAAAGAEPIVCDVFDRPRLARAVRTFEPDLLLHELTDLPDDLEDVPKHSSLNARIRTEGTRNLLDAVEDWQHTKVVAQSIAWTMRPGPESNAVASLEESVLACAASSCDMAGSTARGRTTSLTFPLRRASTSTPRPSEPSPHWTRRLAL